MFEALSQKRFLAKPVVLSNEVEWFDNCRARGLIDILFLMPDKSRVVCCFRDGLVTYFTARWEFVKEIKKWDITYKEKLSEEYSFARPKFDNNENALMDILNKIENFARLIGFENFGDIFAEAKSYLKENIISCDESIIKLPENRKRLFLAASKAYVFGSMGSWNDLPQCVSHEKGLDMEYKTLSTELLKQIKNTLLFSVNEW